MSTRATGSTRPAALSQSDPAPLAGLTVLLVEDYADVYGALKEIGLTQVDLAGDVDVVRTTVSRWERGETAPRGACRRGHSSPISPAAPAR